ncbi:MAG: tetratricopeptide repeat protein, partial [Planctomycetota bacterium]
ADLLAEQDRWEEAWELYQELIEERPEDARVLRGVVNAAPRCDELDEALEALDTLIDKDRKRLPVLVEEKMDLLYGANRLAEAARMLPDLLRREKRPYPRGLKWAQKFLAEDPEDVREWRQIARIRERRGEPEKAYEALKKALSLKPDHAKTREKAGFLASKLGRLGEAIGHFEALRETGKEDRKIVKELAGLLVRAGHLGVAADRFKTWLSLGKPDGGTLLSYGRVLLHLGRFGETAEILEKAASLGNEEAGALRERLGRDLLDGEIGLRVEELAGEGAEPSARLPLARAFLERGLFRPAVSLAMEAAARAEAKAEATGEALTFLTDLHGLDPGDSPIAFFLADRFRERGEGEKAIPVLRRYLREKPFDAKAKQALIAFYLEAEKHDRALSLVEELLPFGAIYREPVREALMKLHEGGAEDARVPLFLGRVAAESGETGEAAKRFGEFMALDPDAEEVSAATMTDLFNEVEDPEEVLRWCARAVEEDPEDLHLRLRLAKLAFAQEWYEEAEKHLRDVLDDDPHDRIAGELLGRVEAKKKERYIQDLLDRHEQDPEDGALGIELGRVLLEADRKEEGIAALNRARSDREVGWKAMEALYSHYRAEGDFKKALSYLRELMPRRRPARDSREWKEITYRMGDLHLSLADPVRAGRAFFDIYKTDPKFGDVKAKLELVEVIEELVDPRRSGPPVRWHVAVEGKMEGPMDLGAVKEWIDDDRLSPDDLVWRTGFSGWKQARDADKIGLLFKYRDRL